MKKPIALFAIAGMLASPLALYAARRGTSHLQNEHEKHTLRGLPLVTLFAWKLSSQHIW